MGLVSGNEGLANYPTEIVGDNDSQLHRRVEAVSEQSIISAFAGLGTLFNVV
jgi:hypothetical protein